jgi:signal transduction histidine kinase
MVTHMQARTTTDVGHIWTREQRLARLFRYAGMLLYLVIFPLWDLYDDQIDTLLPWLPTALFHWLALLLAGIATLGVVEVMERRADRSIRAALQAVEAAEAERASAVQERHHAEAELLRTEAARAELAGAKATGVSVAHYINQPLAIMMGYLELHLQAPPEERTDADLRRVLSEISRVALLVQALARIDEVRTIPYAHAGGVPMLDLEAVQAAIRADQATNTDLLA